MSARRGAILLEVLLSLALFVATSLTLLSVVTQSIDGLARSRDRLIAADHARSAMARIEAGLARPETLHGPVATGDTDSTLDEAIVGIDPGDDVPGLVADEPASEWWLEVQTEPTEFDGLTLCRVRAYRVDGEGREFDGAPSYTLSQIVTLGGGGGAPIDGGTGAP